MIFFLNHVLGNGGILMYFNHLIHFFDHLGKMAFEKPV